MTQGTAKDVAANAVPPLDAFRDPTLARSLIDTIHALAGGHAINLMEVCGTHTVSIGRYGFRSVMPDGLRLLSGPGCPVCVTANQDVDHAIALARVPGAIIATFGDMMRVPGSTSSLAAEKAAGRDVRMVYSPLDALSLAHDNPGSEVIFMGVGFETTTPTIAAAILEAQAQNLGNFSVFCAHKPRHPHSVRLQAIRIRTSTGSSFPDTSRPLPASSRTGSLSMSSTSPALSRVLSPSMSWRASPCSSTWSKRTNPPSKMHTVAV